MTGPLTITDSLIRWSDLTAPGVRGTTIGQAAFGSVNTVIYRNHRDGRVFTAHHSDRMTLWLVTGNKAWWIVEHNPTDRADTDGPALRRSQVFTTEDTLNAAWEQLFDPR